MLRTRVLIPLAVVVVVLVTAGLAFGRRIAQSEPSYVAKVNGT